MAGKIVVSTVQSDTDNSISFVANTGATIFSANLSHGIAGSFIADGTVTGPKIGQTAINANNIVNSTITTTQIASNTISNTNIATGAIENYMRASGGFQGMRNRLINGNMLIWQRGTSTSSTGYQTADRWSAYADSGISVSRSTDVPANTGHYYSLTISGTGSTGITQKIESYNANTLVGSAATISFWAKRTSGSGNIGIYLYSANTQDNFDATTTIGSTTISPSTSWAYYTVNFSNIPAASSNGIQLTIKTESASAVTMFFTGIQMESGSNPTPFEYRQYGTELQLCERYYEKTGFGHMAIAESGTTYVMNITYRTTKRTQPSIGLFTTSNIRVRQFGTADRDATSPTLNSSTGSTNGGYLKVSGFASIGSTSTPAGIGYTTSSENGDLFYASAEL